MLHTLPHKLPSQPRREFDRSEQFDRRMLPLLGVSWNRFATLQEANKFADWAERTTKYDEHPCDAFVAHDADNMAEPFEVKVVNW